MLFKWPFFPVENDDVSLTHSRISSASNPFDADTFNFGPINEINAVLDANTTTNVRNFQTTSDLLPQPSLQEWPPMILKLRLQPASLT